MLIVPAGEPDAIIEWLKGQPPQTWHCVVSNWNYDYGDKVLTWILNQTACDRGTAAHIFFVEGLGHWIGDALLDEAKFHDPKHVCRIILDNWHSYATGDLRHGYRDPIPADLLSTVQDRDPNGLFKGTALAEIIAYVGQRDAHSMYGSEDGAIKIDFNYWAKEKGITVP